MKNWKQRARGSVLIVSLVILLVLTLLGISGMDDTVLQERMAGNMQEGLSAFQAAEAGLRYGELELSSSSFDPGGTVFSPSCNNGFCQPAEAGSDAYDVWVREASVVFWDPTDFSNDVNTRRYGGLNSPQEDLQNLTRSRQPAYIVERLRVVERTGSVVIGFAKQPPSEWYRITSRGFGRNGQSQATVQSVIRK